VQAPAQAVCRHLHRRCAGTCTGGVQAPAQAVCRHLHRRCARRLCTWTQSSSTPVWVRSQKRIFGVNWTRSSFFVGQMHFILPNHLVLKHRGKLKALSFMCAAYMYVHMNSVCAMDVTEFECESECCQIPTIFCKSKIWRIFRLIWIQIQLSF